MYYCLLMEHVIKNSFHQVKDLCLHLSYLIIKLAIFSQHRNHRLHVFLKLWLLIQPFLLDFGWWRSLMTWSSTNVQGDLIMLHYCVPPQKIESLLMFLSWNFFKIPSCLLVVFSWKNWIVSNVWSHLHWGIWHQSKT